MEEIGFDDCRASSHDWEEDWVYGEIRLSLAQWVGMDILDVIDV